MKKLLRLFVLSFVLFCFAGCASGAKSNAGENTGSDPVIAEEATEETGPVNTETVDFLPSEENVKFLGRAVYENDSLIMSYSSTGAAFNINAKRLDVSFIGDGSEARILVFVNGERKLDEMMTRSKTFTVFDQKELVTGEIRVVKASESTSSSVALEKITTDKDGTISPAAAKALKIEFVGDSITCGYGVDDLNRNNHFKVSTEDNTKSYAYKTAQTLDADYSMVSCSGWGIISGYSGDGTKQTWGILPNVYGKLGANSKSVNGISPAKIDWDFTKFVPDVIVVNLGTNDASYTKGDGKKVTEFKDAYVKFIKQIREVNQNAYIICSLGIMGQDLYSAIDTAVTEYKAETGDNKVCSLKFDQQNMGDGVAADWHPSEKTHAKAANKLTAKIKEIIE